MLAANKLFIDVETARELVDTREGQFYLGYEVIEHKEEGKGGRWTILWSIVIRDAGTYYKAYYEVGATEIQEDMRPWDWEDTAEFFRAEPKQRTEMYYEIVDN